jgi:hypothetical protein
MNKGRVYLYIRALFYIPVGFFALQYGIKSLYSEVGKDINSYNDYQGYVSMMTDTTLFDKEIGSYYDASKIVIEDSIFYTRITKFRNLINENLELKNHVIVYYRREEGENNIKALYRGDEPIIAYKNVYWVAISVIVFGLVMSFLSIGALLSGIKSVLKGEAQSDDEDP